MAQPTVANSTLEYFDGFDDYNTSQILRYWTNWVATFSAVVISPGNGRNGTASLRIGLDGDYVNITLGPQATRTIGFAFRTAGVTSTPSNIASLLDGSTAQLSLRLNLDLTLSVLRGATVLSTTSFALAFNIYYYVEFTSVINSSSGSYNLHINGVSKASGSGINTQNTANSSANGVQLGYGSGSNSIGPWDFDDFYSRTDGIFCGDVRVETKLPNANGATNNFIPLTGSNFTEVSDNPADDDTSYNKSSNPGDIDLYTYPALATTAGAIQAVMTLPIERVDTAGGITAQSVYHSGGTNYFGGTQSISAATYNSYPDIQGFNPNTAAPWTIAGVNAAQFGLKRVT